MKALVLSGGGAKGQYHVGAIQALYGDLGKRYEILCGVSVGALIAAHLAQYPMGDETHAADDLEALFSPIRTRDVYRRWFPFGFLQVPWKPALYDARPLRRLIRENLDVQRVRTSGHKLRIGTVSLTVGEYDVFTEHDPDLAEIVYSSAAFPVAFPPGRFRNQWWADGGVKSVTPIQAAIEAGATEIDVVMTSPPESEPKFERDPEAIDVALRSIELMGDRIIELDVKMARLYNRLIGAGGAPEKKHITMRVIRPESVLLHNSLHFDPDDAERLQMQGYRDVHLATG